MFCIKCGSQIADGSKFCNVCGNKMIIPKEAENVFPVNDIQMSQTMPVGQFNDVPLTAPAGKLNDVPPTAPVGQFNDVPPTAPVGQQFGNILPTMPVEQQFGNVSPTMPVEPMVNTSGYQNYSGTKDIPLGNYPQSNNEVNKDEKAEDKKSGNKGIIIGLISAVVVLAIVVVVLLVKPSSKKSDSNGSKTTEQYLTTEAKNTEAVTAAKTEEKTETATEASSNTDKGGSFMIVDGLLSVDSGLFNKTYDELNEYFEYSLPSLTYWEWSEVPLDYLDYYYSDGNKYTLFFENNKLIAVRYETKTSSYSIPDKLFNAATTRFGSCDEDWKNWDTDETVEYDWDSKITIKMGKYAIFLNSYDGNDYVVQQYTVGEYTGSYIQNHDNLY